MTERLSRAFARPVFAHAFMRPENAGQSMGWDNFGGIAMFTELGHWAFVDLALDNATAAQIGACLGKIDGVWESRELRAAAYRELWGLGAPQQFAVACFVSDSAVLGWGRPIPITGADGGRRWYKLWISNRDVENADIAQALKWVRGALPDWPWPEGHVFAFDDVLKSAGARQARPTRAAVKGQPSRSPMGSCSWR